MGKKVMIIIRDGQIVLQEQYHDLATGKPFFVDAPPVDPKKAETFRQFMNKLDCADVQIRWGKCKGEF